MESEQTFVTELLTVWCASDPVDRQIPVDS